LSERQTPVFSESPRIELASNTFENVPVLIQFGDEPLIEMVKDDQPGYTTQIAIYDRNGTYLAKAKGSQLYLTEKGANAGVELRRHTRHGQHLPGSELPSRANKASRLADAQEHPCTAK
jgi:hypothetical protein